MPFHHDQELNELKERLLTMASQAETAVRRAVQALLERDDDLARRVKVEDSTLDQLEMELDERSITLLAKAPLASDLRLITVAMKISHDLERVGDEATTIARRSLELSKEPPLGPYAEIPPMANLVLEMLKAALDAFVSRAPEKARAVLPRDKEVDGLNRTFQSRLAELMQSHPETVGRGLHLTVVSKSLERIGDHATNIAEEVVYLYEAIDIRHSGKGGTIGGAAKEKK